MSSKPAASPSSGARKRRQVARLATASIIVTGLVTSAGVYLANPATEPATIEVTPTAAPSPNRPVDPAEIELVEGGQGGGVTPDSALGEASIRPGNAGQVSGPNAPALDSVANPTGLQAVQWPLATGSQNITSGFGPRTSPCSGCSSNHRGLDFAGAVGSPVGSISAGIVIDVTPTDQGGLGVHVVVEHRIDGKITRSVYAHMLAGSLTVKPGDVVLAGEKLGELGNTGSSTGPHLHLEIIIAGTHVDPYTFLKKYADDEDVEVIDRPPVDWKPDQDPDAEGEGWTPNQDTLDVAPDDLPVVAPKGPTKTPKPGEPDATPSPSTGPETGTPSPTESATPSPTPSGTGTPTPPPTGGADAGGSDSGSGGSSSGSGDGGSGTDDGGSGSGDSETGGSDPRSPNQPVRSHPQRRSLPRANPKK